MEYSEESLRKNFNELMISLAVMSRAHEEWLKYGFRHQVQLYGTYSKTDEQMRQILRVCAAMDPFATAGWKWGTTSDVEWGHIDAILPGDS